MNYNCSDLMFEGLKKLLLTGVVGGYLFESSEVPLDLLVQFVGILELLSERQQVRVVLHLARVCVPRPGNIGRSL